MLKTADQLLSEAFGADHIKTSKGERLYEREKLNPTTAYEIVQTKNPKGAWVVNIATETGEKITKMTKPFQTVIDATEHIDTLRKAKHGQK